MSILRTLRPWEGPSCVEILPHMAMPKKVLLKQSIFIGFNLFVNPYRGTTWKVKEKFTAILCFYKLYKASNVKFTLSWCTDHWLDFCMLWSVQLSQQINFASRSTFRVSRQCHTFVHLSSHFPPQRHWKNVTTDDVLSFLSHVSTGCKNMTTMLQLS